MTESAYVFNEKNWEIFKKDLKKLVGDTAFNNCLCSDNGFAFPLEILWLSDQ